MASCNCPTGNVPRALMVGSREVGERTTSVVISIRRRSHQYHSSDRLLLVLQKKNQRSGVDYRNICRVHLFRFYIHRRSIMTTSLDLDLSYIAAPMVNQSDTPFRALVHRHGATLTYTEMLRPTRLLSDPDYLAFHRRALELGRPSAGPVVVQVCGNDPDVIVRSAKTVVDLCDGIGPWSGAICIRGLTLTCAK